MTNIMSANICHIFMMFSKITLTKALQNISKFILTQVKAELGGKQDRVNTLRQEIAENERQVKHFILQ